MCSDASSDGSPRRQAPIEASGLGKCYHVYRRPADRLKQAALGALGSGRRYYDEFWALRDVGFEVPRGTAMGVIGRNGSGKSTLLQMIAGTLTPTEGRAVIRGRVAALLELGSGFNAEFTGRENVYMNGAILGLSRREMDDRFEDIAAFADIGEFIDQPVKTYSSGMMVRLAFAVQVQVEPEILIVDEALAVGDNLFQKRCFERLEQLRAGGVTILFVSHDQESVRTLTDRALLLHHGRALAYGTSAEVLLEYRRLLHTEEKAYFAHATETVRKKAEATRRALETAGAAGAAGGGAAAGGKSERMSFGGLDAEVLRVEVLGEDGSAKNHFYPGEAIGIAITCRVNRDMDKINIAFRLRNKQGVKVTSWGTLNADIDTWHRGLARETTWERSFRKGEEFTAVFSGRVNLGHNLYEVQATITEEGQRFYGAQRILHWRDEAAFFNVSHHTDTYTYGGVCDMGLQTRVVSGSALSGSVGAAGAEVGILPSPGPSTGALRAR